VPRLDSTRYTLLFATAVCVVCALVVATAAVLLQPIQEENARLYRQKNVLIAAGLVRPDQKVSRDEVLKIFERNIRIRLIDLKTGALLPAERLDPLGYDQRRARNDPSQSRPAPENDAGVNRLPNYAAVHFVVRDEAVEQLVLAVEGLGMWGTIYGYLALDRDGNTVRGITYYDQKETPGLGGEIANPSWQALWKGRRVYDERWRPGITVIKGAAGTPEVDPLHVDGLSGATITSNAITRLTRFWMGESGYGEFLRKFREGGTST
jgi:Na+-transporting NADH:ubiquinone oxidoreductase subunit C